MSFPREQKYTIKNMSLIPYYFLSPICPQSNTFIGDISQLESGSALWLKAKAIVIQSKYHTT